MSSVDLFGYAASALVIVTFYMREMVPLRAAALCSNLCFLVYGLSLKLGPVALLHLALIPINVWRLSEALSGSKYALWAGFGRRFGFLREKPAEVAGEMVERPAGRCELHGRHEMRADQRADHALAQSPHHRSR